MRELDTAFCDCREQYYTIGSIERAVGLRTRLALQHNAYNLKSRVLLLSSSYSSHLSVMALSQ